ncbi:hypothetical protein [Streptomyces sp. NPDC047097]|uniref:hypothetical protein n=1 Tax=Streptomyces sp. NPDC047097 TaxID=3155260 RepID=UPI0033ED3724
MSEPPPGVTVLDGPVSLARLHGEACITCGATPPRLEPVGHVQIRGEERSWPVAACPAHAHHVGSVPCRYCPAPDPDVVIRVAASASGPDHPVYAHLACAEARGEKPLYKVGPGAGEEAAR